MKKLLTLMMLTLMLVAFGVTTAEAAPSDAISVTVTITADALDVSVTPNAWAIGNIAVSDTPDTGADFFTATNGRNTTEDLTLTVSTLDDWTFANTPGADQFAMNFSINQGGLWTLIDVSTGGSLATGLAASASQSFDLQLEAPTSTVNGDAPQTIVVTVTAS